MGEPKAWLRFGDEFLLQRIVRIVNEVCPQVVVVRAANQTIPPLPPSVVVVADERPGCGPLAGLERGLKELGSEAVFLTSCDLPLLTVDAVRLMCAEMTDEVDVVLPRNDDRLHPLFAAYRRSVLPTVTKLLDAGERKMMTLIHHLRVKDIDDLPADVLRNTNTPAEYAEVLKRISHEMEPISSSPLPSVSDS
jgi:molybdopterin-guanine dinucleotide biosynthesis protein A